MLEGVIGVRLTLWIGRGVPRPAGHEVTEHLVSTEVAVSDRERSGFELKFNAIRSANLVGGFPIVREPGLQAGARVIVMATIGIRPQVLIDGIVETAEFSPAQGDGPAQLVVRGKDLTFAMDREEREVSHPAMGPGEIAMLVLARYASFGIIPVVDRPQAAETPNPTDRVPMQKGTDYAYLTELAGKYDRIFTIIPGPAPLTSMAYWGPPPRIGTPQRALTSDMGPETNVSNLNFENAASEAANVTGNVQDRQTNQSVPVRSVVPLRVPLALNNPILQPGVAKTNLFRTHGAPTAAQAMGEAQAQSDASSDVVKVTGDLDTGRYNAILEPRRLVGLRGAGLDNSGLYYVKDVVHKISRGSWIQSFTLNREGTGSTVPVVLQ